tara:strand:+ start:16587 stop:18149 length:1563 start_codon:yes stop_codon:yes gene_type:complete
MAIYSKLSNIRRLTNSSLGSIIEVSNLNFNDLSIALLEFLNNVEYDETTNAIKGLDSINVKEINVDNNLSVKLNGVTTFNIDSQGRAEGNSFLVEVAEAKRYRHTDFPNWPDVGVAGEIIYTGIQNQRPEFGEDFIGYLDGRGWVSLTENGGVMYGLTLLETTGSPGIAPTPAPGSGIVWIGNPNLATTHTPTTQDLYFTDENGEIFRLTCCGGGGGGGGNNASYIETTNFVSNVTKTITHGLGTDSVVVDFIDTVTGDRIDGHIDDYDLNSIDVTMTQDMSSVRIVILSAGGTGSGGSVTSLTTNGTSGPSTLLNGVLNIPIYGGGTGDEHCIWHTITSDLEIPEHAMYIVWGDMEILPGVTVDNNGRLIIVNGSLINNGTYNQSPTGEFELVKTNLAYTLNQGDTTFGNHMFWTDIQNVWNAGDSTDAINTQDDNVYVTKEWVNSKKYVEEYLSTGGQVWDSIIHQLNTEDILVELWDMDIPPYPTKIASGGRIRIVGPNEIEIKSKFQNNIKVVVMS